jgi:hypothetical protein
MHSVSFVFDGKVFAIMFSGYSLACHMPLDDPHWPAAHNHRGTATVEDSTSAPPATSYGAMRIKRGKDRGEPAQALRSSI